MFDGPLCGTQLPFELLPTICVDPKGPLSICISTKTVKREEF